MEAVAGNWPAGGGLATEFGWFDCAVAAAVAARDLAALRSVCRAYRARMRKRIAAAAKGGQR